MSLNLRERLAAAVNSVGDTAPRTSTRSSAGGVVTRGRRNTAERIQPPKRELERYWRLYESVPLIRAPINQFAADVIGDGYRIQADDERTKEFLQEWTSRAAIVAGERDRDLSELLREIPIQLEARGTCLIEHAPAREDVSKIAGLSMVQPETVTPYSQPGTSLLVRPGDTQLDGVKTTEDGEAAAYVQFDQQHSGRSEDERRLTIEDVTKLVNDPDISDVFGTSSIEPVADRVDALLGKLANNEQALESLAWGRFFLGFDPVTLRDAQGGEQLVEWDRSDMQAFMDELDSVEPGDLIGHDGTINVENMPGEVADIIEVLHFDIDYILSAMPAPSYAVGAGVERSINQFVTEAQETRHDERVTSMRNQIERALTPVLGTVAEQNGYASEGVALRLEPEEEVSPIMSLSDAEIDRITAYADAVDTLSGGDPYGLVGQSAMRELILQLPEDAATGVLPPLEEPPGPEEELSAHDIEALVDRGEALHAQRDSEETELGVGVPVDIGGDD